MAEWASYRSREDDNALARRAQHGDRDAYTCLVRRHQDRIYGLAWRMVGADAADDLVQQAFLKAWLALDHFHGNASFGTWLYRLAMNVCLDELRRAGRFRLLALDTAEAVLQADDDVAEIVIEGVEQAARSLALAHALEHLPTEDRLLLHLRVIDGLTYAAIAELLGIKSITVGTRLFRARARLHALVVQQLAEGCT
jgi:RNA polymerase sigma-70 factor, ECF subfamily